MKLKIKVKIYNNGKVHGVLPRIIKKGDWIDLCALEPVEYKAGDSGMIHLGVAMELPKGYEALVLPRSSTFKKYGIILVNSCGVIDNSYCGNNDFWQFPYFALRDGSIKIDKEHKDMRICQFRIQLSQKATFWQKLKWLFSSGIELEQVDNLTSSNRGGFGSTDNK